MLGMEQTWVAGEGPPWPAGTHASVLVPAAAAPVFDADLPDMPLAQALAAARIGASRSELDLDRHVAVAANGARLLTATASSTAMDSWLASAAAAGLAVRALVPAGLVLPRPDHGMRVGDLGGQVLARTAQAAFAGEATLVQALGDDATSVLTAAEVGAALLAVHADPPLDLRQGRYAPPRVSFFTLPDWQPLARLGASAALLALLAMVVLVVRLNLDASARERHALVRVQQRFPEAADLDSAERLVAAEAAQQGQGARAMRAPLAALLAAMRAAPGVALRDLAYESDGTLRFTAAAPRAEEVNAVLITLQQQGWKVIVPPALAPDPSGATVAAISVTAP